MGRKTSPKLLKEARAVYGKHPGVLVAGLVIMAAALGLGAGKQLVLPSRISMPPALASPSAPAASPGAQEVSPAPAADGASAPGAPVLVPPLQATAPPVVSRQGPPPLVVATLRSELLPPRERPPGHRSVMPQQAVRPVPPVHRLTLGFFPQRGVCPARRRQRIASRPKA